MGVRRVEQLIALATDQAATAEEARTAAIAACREIRREGYAIGAIPALPPPPRREPVDRPARRDRGLSGDRGLPPVPREPEAPKAHIVNFEFRDSETEEGFAFSQALLQGALRRGGG